MLSFRKAVADLQPRFAEAARDGEWFAQPDRLNEADQVEPCVARAAYGETDPTGRRALGRLTKFSPPGLAEYLSRKSRYRADDETAAAIAEAATRAMAVGWMFCAHPEVELAGRSARDVWDFWAGPSLRDSLDQVTGDKKFASLIHRTGADTLSAALSEAKLKPRGPSKLALVGYQITQNGYYLRVCQSTEIDGDTFEHIVNHRRETGLGSADGRWDWDAYPVTDS